MRDKKIISFKEFYLREDHHTGYFPTAKAGYEGIKKYGPGMVKGAAKGIGGAAKLGAKGLTGLAKGALGTAKAVGKGVKAGANFAKSMAPGYKPQFSVGAPRKGEGGVSDSKSSREAAKRFAEWRNKNITSKDRTPAEQKTFKDFKDSGAIEVPLSVFTSQSGLGLRKAFDKAGYDYKSKGHFDTTGGTGIPDKLKIGQVLPLMVLTDGGIAVGIVDGKYRRAGTAWPKIFNRPGHYANQVVDSMKRYFDTGYKKKQSIDMSEKNFNPNGLAILRSNKYLPWENL